MKKLGSIFGLLVSMIALVVAPTAMAAAAPALYFEQADVSVVGGNVSLPVHVNAAGSSLDTVQIVVTFPADKLTFVGLDKSGSGFTAFVPAVPTDTNGQVTFGAASFSTKAKPVVGDVLVGTLLFTAKATSGVGEVSLSGSQALRSGVTLTGTTTSVATLHFGAGSTTGGGLGLGNVAATDITVNNTTIRWHTDVPATSGVDYGQTSSYGASVGSQDLVTDHRVKIGSVLPGGTKIHYRVSSVAVGGAYQASEDKAFTTLGYTVAITARDKSGQPLSGASVQVVGGHKAKANTSGVAIITNVGPGAQKVVINGGKSQSILVKSEVGAAATKVQQFTLVGEPAAFPIISLVLAVLVAAAVIVALVMLMKRPSAQPKPPMAPTTPASTFHM